jgi:alpha/beta superfamily hydrolase
MMNITFSSGEWQLEGVLEEANDSDRAAVICHPHPLYGGSMHNPVVRAVEAGVRKAGVTALRFNFRGVGDSTGAYGGGIGEADDLLAAVNWLIENERARRITAAGYSFGAMVILRAGATAAHVDRLIAVAPPLSFFDLGTLSTCTKPKLFIAGDRDQYCPITELNRQLTGVAEPKKSVIFDGADHFLYGHEAGITGAVAEFETTDEPG